MNVGRRQPGFAHIVNKGKEGRSFVVASPQNPPHSSPTTKKLIEFVTLEPGEANDLAVTCPRYFRSANYLRLCPADEPREPIDEDRIMALERD